MCRLLPALAGLLAPEIACRGTGRLLINEAALDKLQALRDRLGKPLIVRTDYRSPEHNRLSAGCRDRSSSRVRRSTSPCGTTTHAPGHIVGHRISQRSTLISTLIELINSKVCWFLNSPGNRSFRSAGENRLHLQRAALGGQSQEVSSDTRPFRSRLPAARAL